MKCSNHAWGHRAIKRNDEKSKKRKINDWQLQNMNRTKLCAWLRKVFSKKWQEEAEYKERRTVYWTWNANRWGKKLNMTLRNLRFIIISIVISKYQNELVVCMDLDSNHCRQEYKIITSKAIFFFLVNKQFSRKKWNESRFSYSFFHKSIVHSMLLGSWQQSVDFNYDDRFGNFWC